MSNVVGTSTGVLGKQVLHDVARVMRVPARLERLYRVMWSGRKSNSNIIRNIILLDTSIVPCVVSVESP